MTVVTEAAETAFLERHEASTAAWREKRRLAAVLRELAAVCVTTDADAATLADAAAAAQEIVDAFQGFPRRTFKDGWASCKTHDDYALFIDRSPLIGESNPNSPLLRLHMEGDTACGIVTFGTPFEGIPGCVHGGMVAAAFDQVFGYRMVASSARAVTGSLNVRYRQPTPLGTELRIEATVDKVDGRRWLLRARLFSGDRAHGRDGVNGANGAGHVTAEAEAVFVTIDAEHLDSVIAAARQTPDAPDPATESAAGNEG